MPIILDTQEFRNDIIRKCGAQPIGEGDPGVALFNDPITKNTLALPIEDITEENVRKKIAASRVSYGLVLIEAAILHNSELISQVESALIYLTQKRNLPLEVIRSASHAAVNEIIAFEIQTANTGIITESPNNFSLITDHSSLLVDDHAA